MLKPSIRINVTLRLTAMVIFAAYATGNVAASPQAVVSGNNFKIEDGTSSQFLAGTIIPTVNLGAQVTRKFRITNAGDQLLTITLPVTTTGPHAADFSVAVQPASSIPPGFDSEFSIVFNPSAAFGRSADVNITTNDPAIGLYNFPIDGNGTAIPPPAVSDLTGFFGQPFKRKCQNGTCEIKGTLFVGNAGEGTYPTPQFVIHVMQGDKPLNLGGTFASTNGPVKPLSAHVALTPVKYAKVRFTVQVPDAPYRIVALLDGSPVDAIEEDSLDNLVTIVPPFP